jgi:hypothetical protein
MSQQRPSNEKAASDVSGMGLHLKVGFVVLLSLILVLHFGGTGGGGDTANAVYFRVRKSKVVKGGSGSGIDVAIAVTTSVFNLTVNTGEIRGGGFPWRPVAVQSLPPPVCSTEPATVLKQMCKKIDGRKPRYG